MVEGIARNLLENAVEYSPVDGEVECRVGDNRLVVVNRQEGIGEGDVAHVFEPFWRKDKARAGGVHAGLGLALVRAYAGAMGGKAEAGVAEGVFRVEVEFGGDVIVGSSSERTVAAVDT
jgi:signal transduction histidine kinase